ncbi:addiction module killer protein [Commensalibacter intestini A911]|uniref:Addiction module killer protein n=1 Tax=Commensalibacter intestini A911 TaxID=1088868 RepID=G6F258_9PROT|nr:addiction module killer protein [Commensalibacter intestini]EHD13512.1 addiction module killer protein [Commensalibacter intestini A911]
MVEVKRLPEFDKWFSNIKDKTVRLRLALRLSKVQRGVFGDVKHLQDDVWEMREFFWGWLEIILHET